MPDQLPRTTANHVELSQAGLQLQHRDEGRIHVLKWRVISGVILRPLEATRLESSMPHSSMARAAETAYGAGLISCLISGQRRSGDAAAESSSDVLIACVDVA